MRCLARRLFDSFLWSATLSHPTITHWHLHHITSLSPLLLLLLLLLLLPLLLFLLLCQLIFFLQSKHGVLAWVKLARLPGVFRTEAAKANATPLVIHLVCRHQLSLSLLLLSPLSPPPSPLPLSPSPLADPHKPSVNGAEVVLHTVVGLGDKLVALMDLNTNRQYRTAVKVVNMMDCTMCYLPRCQRAPRVFSPSPNQISTCTMWCRCCFAMCVCGVCGGCVHVWWGC